MAPSELFSKALRNEIREYYVSIVLRQIALDFEEAGFAADLAHNPTVGGERRRLIEQFYHTIDWRSPTDATKFLELVGIVLGRLDSDITLLFNAEHQARTKERVLKLLEKGGIQVSGGRLTLPLGHSSVGSVSVASKGLNAPDLYLQLQRLTDSTESDPALAIGTAKELTETVCRSILEDHGRTWDPDWDVTRLVKEVREVLQLLPDQIPDRAKGLEAIRKLLGQLGAVSQSLAELRNLYGTGHGRRNSTTGLLPRHARLAVGAASTLVTFLLETHWSRKPPETPTV